MKKLFRKLLTFGARRYLSRVGLIPLLQSGDSTEIPSDLLDLANLYRAVRKCRPKVILEFGTGFSTVVLAHAMGPEGRLYNVDANEHWIANTKAKMPPQLLDRVEFRHSPVRVDLHEGEMCHFYDRLPNIVPDFIYLDGPGRTDIEGEIRGLTFGPSGQIRQQIAADILLYESTMKTGATIVVDSRYNNVHFLVRNLRRRWRIQLDRLRRQTMFVLLEHTGRQ
jgi:hypothetical protein